jgi:hypothetical protein
MPTQTPPNDPPRSVTSRDEATEYFGQGQSGYTAGRVERDPSLENQTRNSGQPPPADEHVDDLGLGTDERFTGQGRAPWAPEDDAPDHEQKGT